MTIFDWLSGPDGVALTHAVIVLVLALAGYLSYRAEQTARVNTAHIQDVKATIADHIAIDHAGGADSPADRAPAPTGAQGAPPQQKGA